MLLFLLATLSPCRAVASEKSVGRLETATFAAGCFWHVEATFRKVPGVVAVTSGYTGGTKVNPTYEQVCSDKTGHAEAIEIEYDPTRVSYGELLDLFWSEHDSTTLNRQGWDVATQYRSAIFYHTAEQRVAALASKERLERSGRYKNPIVTQIVPAVTFYKAEEYHQRYYEKPPMPSSVTPSGPARPAKMLRQHRLLRRRNRLEVLLDEPAGFECILRKRWSPGCEKWSGVRGGYSAAVRQRDRMTRNAPMMVDFPLLLGPTNGLEGDFGEEQLVTVTFKESGGKTNMTLRHVGFLPGEWSSWPVSAGTNPSTSSRRACRRLETDTSLKKQP